MAESKEHRKLVNSALGDEHLQTALNRAHCAYKKARAAAMEGFDLSASQENVRTLKERCISGLEELFQKFKSEAERAGVVVHEAKDGKETAQIVSRLASERGVKNIVKSKSMLTEELELNSRLEEADLRVVETDLGEWIIQLANEKPSHFTAPALHKTREQIAELFSQTTGKQIEPDIQKLVAVARKELRQEFINADMGISGANIAIADTGTIVIVANEGNDRLVTTLPPIHVAVVGYEKLVCDSDDAHEILKVLSKSGTGQKQTSYVSFITGPSRTSDIEKTLTLGVHGPKELHVIFVDAGRKDMALDTHCREALYCIKCGACLNLCPVYKSIGGHAFGNTYMGGIGAVVTAFHKDLDASEDTLGLCTGCGYCTSICPSKIDVPGMVLELRKRLAEKNGIPFAGKVPLALLRHPDFFKGLLQKARMLQLLFIDDKGTLNVPIISSIFDTSRIAGLSDGFLSERLQKNSYADGKVNASIYAGCMIEYIYPEIGQAIYNVLQKSGVNPIYSEGQSCCGAPAIYAGDLYTARELAVNNIKTLLADNSEYIITGCPTCAVMLKDSIPELLKGTEHEATAVELSKKVYDFSYFAANVLNITPRKQINLSVTYHDPCHQVRSLGTSNYPRDIIRSCGAEIIEMADSDECCGFAGSYSIKQPGISGAIINRKIENIGNTSAEAVVTDCPGCIMQIRGGLRKCGSAVSVIHTAQLLAELLD